MKRTILAMLTASMLLGVVVPSTFVNAKARRADARSAIASRTPETTLTPTKPVASPPAAPAGAQSVPPPVSVSENRGPLDVTYERVRDNGKVVTVLVAGETDVRDLTFKDATGRSKVVDATKGDHLKVTVDDVSAAHRIESVEGVTRPVGFWTRILALGAAFAALLLGASLATNWRPQRFLIGVDNRYSNSQCQLAFWFGAVATVYAAAVGLRIGVLGLNFIGGVGLSAHLIALTGLSAFTFGGAKAITVQKVDAATRNAALLNQPAQSGQSGQPVQALPPPATAVAPAKPSAAKANFVRDLVSNDVGQADLGDFQMILITGAAVAIFVFQAFHFLGALELAQVTTLPDVDSTLLATFGLGQGAYLFKKAATRLREG